MKRILLLCAVMLLAALPVRAQLYDAIVAQDGTGDYLTIQDAILSIRDYKPEGRQRILVRRGVYEEKVIVPTYKTNISLIGESRDSCILVWHDHANLQTAGQFLSVVKPDGSHRLGTFQSYTLQVLGEGFECENMTIVNDAMTHYNPQWWQTRSNEAGVGQAVAVHCEADRAVFRHCTLRGFQDTVFNGNPRSRQIFYGCRIEGTVDFIFGPATVWFERCTLHAIADGYLTAASTPAENPTGYVFHRCRITADPAVRSLYLGRPWRAYASVVFRECELPAAVRPEGWHDWSDPSRQLTARFAEYRSSGPGARPEQRVAWSRQLSQPEATNLTIERALHQRGNTWQSNFMPVPFRDVHFAFYDENLDLGTRYVAGALEPDPLPADPLHYVEPLVMKLDGVDCTTLVEYISAAILGRCASPEPTDSIFRRFVQALRYRHGIRGNYATRKHYFSEWISDGERYCMMQDLTSQLPGARPLKKKLSFMSSNPDLYPQLKACPALLSQVREVEQQLSQQSVWYLPKAQIRQAYRLMRHGDIVAFVTDRPGLDIQHVGFVWYTDTEQGEPQLMHASSQLHRVCVDVRSLQDYALDAPHCIGIRIIRLRP